MIIFTDRREQKGRQFKMVTNFQNQSSLALGYVLYLSLDLGVSYFLEIYFKENNEMTQWKLGSLWAGKRSSFPILTLSIQETDMTLLKALSEQQPKKKKSLHWSFVFQKTFSQRMSSLKAIAITRQSVW